MKETLEDYDATGKNVEWAKKLIENPAKVQEGSREQTFRKSSTTVDTTLVYGDGGQGLLFLEEEYAVDIGDFREALYRAKTWGDLKGMVTEQRYRETVEAWMETEHDRLSDEAEDDEEPEVAAPEPDDTFDAEEIAGYSDGDWPEFSPRMMGTWVDRGIITGSREKEQ